MEMMNPRDAFLRVCNMQRLEVILGNKEKASGFLSDFILIAQKFHNSDFFNIAHCAVEVASMNLSILPQIGQAYLVPRNKVINVEIGYRGWELLARRAGILCRTYPVFEGDLFEIESIGFDQKVKFKPSMENLSQNHTPEFVEKNLKFFVVVTKDINLGVEQHTIINRFLLEKLKSKGANNSPAYRDWILEMYQAKAIKYALRKIPLEKVNSSALRSINKALEIDDQNDEAFENIEVSKKRSIEKKPSEINKAFSSVLVENESVMDPEPEPIPVEVEKSAPIAGVLDLGDDDNPF